MPQGTYLHLGKTSQKLQKSHCFSFETQFRLYFVLSKKYLYMHVYHAVRRHELCGKLKQIFPSNKWIPGWLAVEVKIINGLQ